MLIPPTYPRRLIAVGDIHGRLDLLTGLIDAIAPTERDRLVFLGDYINYGEESRAVVDFLLDLQTRVHCIFLKGDCEAMLLKALTREDVPYYQFAIRGGGKTWKSYGGTTAIPSSHLDFYNNLQLSHQEDRFFFSHAGANPKFPLERQKPTDLLMGGETFCTENPWKKVIVSGHSPTRKPRWTAEDWVLLDGGPAWPGCDRLGRIAACDLKTGEFFVAGNEEKPPISEDTMSACGTPTKLRLSH